MSNLSVHLFGKAHGASKTVHHQLSWCSTFRKKRARVVGVVIKTRKVTLKSSIAFKNVELSLALWYKSAELVTGGQIKCVSPQIKKLYWCMSELMKEKPWTKKKLIWNDVPNGWKGFKILKCFYRIEVWSLLCLVNPSVDTRDHFAFCIVFCTISQN